MIKTVVALQRITTNWKHWPWIVVDSFSFLFVVPSLQSPFFIVILHLFMGLWRQNLPHLEIHRSWSVAIVPPASFLVVLMCCHLLRVHCTFNSCRVVITVTSKWARWRLKSPASWLSVQPFVQVQIKQNIKGPRHWPLWVESTAGFPSQRANNAENVSIWWHHHGCELASPWCYAALHVVVIHSASFCIKTVSIFREKMAVTGPQ